MNKNTSIPYYLIESFLTVARAPSFQVAAEGLGLTQSALSRQMKLIEEFLPQAAFTIEGRKKVLTAYGQTLYDLLAPQFAQTEGLIREAHLMHSNVEKARIHIAGRSELLNRLSVHLRFKGQVNFSPMDSSQALQAVLGRKCDVGIVHQAVDSHEIILKEFFSNRLRIVVPKKLVKGKILTVTNLAAHIQTLPSLLYKEDDPVVQNFLKEFGISFQDLSVSRVFSNYNSLTGMLNEAMGWAVIPSDLRIDEDKFHIFQLKGRTQDERRFYLCYRKEFKNSVWFKELIEEFKSFS